MTIFGVILFWVCQLYTLVLVARVIIDFVQILARDWYPTGAILVVANVVYKLTNPPLRFLGKYIPPLNLGGISLDLGFLVLFIGVQVLQRLSYLL